ncbi:ATP synthase subunit I [Facilibium subflavum]|uniref:ATP synthase subunit I n=1 Tax=Facilibium subflavum TaxID=2219058 RepID=UPI000E65B4EB|nr:ATP synthase subunit I [Facilibium subflavum]
MLANRKLYKKHFFAFQSLLVIGGSLLCFFWGASYAYSFLLGAVLMFAANVIFLLRLFLKKTQYHPLKEVCILYACEFAKLFVVAVGTVLIAIYIQPKFLSYIAGLLVLQLAMWFMPLFMKLTTFNSK